MDNPMERDFDSWASLADRDPERFESRRQAVIDAAIADAPEPHRERLRRLQWRIEQERRRSPNALASCISLSRMMWERVVGDHGLLDALNGHHLNGHDGNRRAPVLPLSRKH